MPFSVSTRCEQGFDLFLLKDSLSGAEVALLPQFGALIHSFTLPLVDEEFNIIDNYPDAATLKKTLDTSYKGSKLSPFPCRIQNGRYRFEGRDFNFEKKFPDGSAIHGLLFDRAFRVTEHASHPESATISMEYAYAKDDRAYPFEYTCQVNYVLEKNRLLTVTTTVTNDGNQSLPIADGWHPYFRLGGKVDQWQMRFDAGSMVEFDDALIPTGSFLPFEGFASLRTIGNRQFDNCFLLDPGSTPPQCTLKNPINGLSIDFFAVANYPYLQIYTPPHRQSIAIENLSAAPDSLNNHLGLTVLAPKQSESFTLKYQPRLD